MWVLIVILLAPKAGSFTAEFTTKDKCEAAATAIKQTIVRSDTDYLIEADTYCMEK